MPFLKYKCKNVECLSLTSVYLANAKEAQNSIECKKCSQQMERVLGGPSMTTKMTVDNGLGGKAIDIYHDQVEVFKQHEKSVEQDQND